MTKKYQACGAEVDDYKTKITSYLIDITMKAHSVLA